MTQWSRYLRAGLRHPPHVALAKALRLGARLGRERYGRLRDLRETTFMTRAPEGALRRRIRLADVAMADDDEAHLMQATANYLGHRFDLLGSGWREVRHGADCSGLAGHRFAQGPGIVADGEGAWLAGRINAANLDESRRVWRLIRQPHVAIDWQLDFKSGYRWSERTHFRKLRYGHVLGADVKIPWELARLQHLPQLALGYRLAAAGRRGFGPPAGYVEAFRNQTLDFIANNPPRFGVNWACAMDVAIRAVNLLIALDLFVDAGALFDRPFLDVVRRGVAEHGRHVVDNLEWAEADRGNHYYADIVGLLFIAAYLPRSIEIDAWFSFAAREFIAESARQFLPDGGNIEASTAYHCLSGELLAHGCALLLGVDEEEAQMLSRPQRELPVRPPQPATGLKLHDIGTGHLSPLPEVVLGALAAAGRLARHATKPSNAIVQWGDNDSGRLMKLQPAWVQASHRLCAGESERIVENTLDHRAFVVAAAALTAQRQLEDWAGRRMEGALARALARGRAAPAVARRPDGDITESSLADLLAAIDRLAPESRRAVEIPVAPGFFTSVKRVAYPDFGHYAFLSPRLFLAIRCPAREFGAAPGHAHDDALAVELQIDGRNVLTDPGTFVYTPLPRERNRYRAAAAHSVPRPAGDGGADLSRGLFEIYAMPGARCLHFGPRGFAGQTFGPGWLTMRVLLCETDRLAIIDACFTGPLAPLAARQALPRVCFGYGSKTAHSPRAC